MKKIGFITEDYWCGGLARFTINLINNWPDNATRFIVFTNKENTFLKQEILNPNTEFVYFNFNTPLSAPGSKRNILKKILRRTLFKYAFFILRYSTLKKLLKKHAIDGWIISNGGYPGSDLCRLALLILKKQKGIFVFHGAMQRPSCLFFLLEMALDKLIFKYNRLKCVTVSHANAKTISKRPWLSDIPVNVIYNGVDLPPASTQKKYPSEEHTVAMLSGLRAYKGQGVIIHSADRLRSEGFNLKVKFYGIDYDRFMADIKNTIAASAYPDIFSMPGFRKVEEIMKDADIIVVPSLTYESFGFSAAEAFAYGVPVIVSDVGGLPEVAGDAAIVCKAGDIDAWSGAIKKALTDVELRHRNIEKGIKRVKENFSIKNTISSYRKLLEEYARY